MGTLSTRGAQHTALGCSYGLLEASLVVPLCPTVLTAVEFLPQTLFGLYIVEGSICRKHLVKILAYFDFFFLVFADFCFKVYNAIYKWPVN